MAQQINTIIVLRNDQTTNWEKSSHVMLKGEVGIGYLENGNVIAKLGDGEHSWKDLPQIEGVFEDNVTLTYNFGKHTIDPSVGFKTVEAKGMTTSQWLLEQLSEVDNNPTINQPSSTFKIQKVTGAGGEIGSKITKIEWNGGSSFGSYQYGPATGVSASNRTWEIESTIGGEKLTSTSEDGSFTVDIQLTQEAEKTYATVFGKCTIDATNAAYANNNVGKPTTLKVSSYENTHEVYAKASAYRRPYYGVFAAGSAVDVSTLDSAAVKKFPSSGTSTKGLPSSISVPKGSQMVIFAARAGAYSSLTATDDFANNSTVSFTKVANAVRVKGYNDFVTSTESAEKDGALYDIWYVNWNPDNAPGYTGISSAKKLTLKWS